MMALSKTSRITIVLAIVFLLGSLSGLIVTPPTPRDPASNTITVMTYNIYQTYTPGGEISLADLRGTIAEADPDILGLEECDSGRVSSMNIDTVLWLADELGMYSYYGPPSSEQLVGVALLSRYPIVNATYHSLTHQELPRALIHAVVLVGDIELNVFVVHLGLSYEDRTTQAAEVMGFVNAVAAPKVLLGDFNTLPTGHPEPGVVAPDDTIYSDISEHMNDTWTASGNERDSPSGYTWPSLEPYERIDYIWVSHDTSVASCNVLTEALGSDHLPVVAQVVLPIP